MSFLAHLLQPKGPQEEVADQEPHGSSEPSSSSSSSSEPSHISDVEGDGLLLQLLRKQRTEKARQASLVSRAIKKEREKVQDCADGRPGSDYIPNLQPNCPLTQPGQCWPVQKLTRMRLLLSWFTEWVRSVSCFFKESGASIKHSINVCIIDDTNMRLTTSYDERGLWRGSRVVSVMNNWQTLVFGMGDEGHVQTYLLHTPMLPLEKANTAVLAKEFCSWIFCWLGQIGERYQRLGAVSVAPGIQIQCVSIAWDSLPTNTSVLKGLREKVHVETLRQKHMGNKTRAFPAFSAHCAIHQIALCRKQLLFFFKGLWSSIVRLSHLFELHSFRCQFRAALVRIICQNFEFIPTTTLPEDFSSWKEERNRCTNVSSHERIGSVQRLRAHISLSRLDNGSVSCKSFTHWCIGNCCQGSSLEEKKRWCLIQICRGYILLFGKGFPVPLTYRWLHASRALGWCKATWYHLVVNASVGKRNVH